MKKTFVFLGFGFLAFGCGKNSASNADNADKEAALIKKIGDLEVYFASVQTTKNFELMGKIRNETALTLDSLESYENGVHSYIVDWPAGVKLSVGAANSLVAKVDSSLLAVK